MFIERAISAQTRIMQNASNRRICDIKKTSIWQF